MRYDLALCETLVKIFHEVWHDPDVRCRYGSSLLCLCLLFHHITQQWPCASSLSCIILLFHPWVYHLIVSFMGISSHCIIHGCIISLYHKVYLISWVCHLLVFHLLALSSCCIIMGISFDHFFVSYGISSPCNDSLSVHYCNCQN